MKARERYVASRNRRLRASLRQVGLDVLKAKERPQFEEATPDRKNTAYIHIKTSLSTKSWSGYLKREGFIYSGRRRCWAYCAHDDGTPTTLEECEWLAQRVREMVAGEISVIVYAGLFVEPVFGPPVLRERPPAAPADVPGSTPGAAPLKADAGS